MVAYGSVEMKVMVPEKSTVLMCLSEVESKVVEFFFFFFFFSLLPRKISYGALPGRARHPVLRTKNSRTTTFNQFYNKNHAII